jgi:hypothetical protein
MQKTIHVSSKPDYVSLLHAHFSSNKHSTPLILDERKMAIVEVGLEILGIKHTKRKCLKLMSVVKLIESKTPFY